jgi:chromosomal replication initiation ATPase DnaA
MNVWDRVLETLREQLDSDEFRRWFAETSYASDAGDQVTVWVPSQSAARHLGVHYQHLIDAALAEVNRPEVHVRFIATGIGEDEDAHEE